MFKSCITCCVGISEMIKLSTLFLNSWAILLHVILMKKLFVSKLSVKLNMIFVSYIVGSRVLSNHPSWFCLKIPNPDATSVGIGKSQFWSPESYFRQINKETKYLTCIWGKVKVWTKKTANKNALPSVSGCIAFVQGLLRLVTSHAFQTSGKYQAWKQAWNDAQ